MSRCFLPASVSNVADDFPKENCFGVLPKISIALCHSFTYCNYSFKGNFLYLLLSSIVCSLNTVVSKDF